MITEQQKLNKEVVLRYNKEVLEKGSVDAIHEIIHTDFIDHNLPQGAVQGPQGIINFVVDVFHQAFKEVTVETFDQIAEDDKVVTRKTIYGNHIANFMGIEPSNEKVAIPLIDIITFKNGQFMEHWSIINMQEVNSRSLNKKP